MTPVSVKRGDGAVILAMPHGGTHVPQEIHAQLNDRGRALADTDWHISRLYEGLLDEATVVAANFHRYVIDANRDPSGASLYPGQNTTGLCPLTDFDGKKIYDRGCEPSAEDIAMRVGDWHAPYHTALLGEIERVKKKHGAVIIYDCHSIRSVIPYLFDGQLPVFNLGTNGGTSCHPRIERQVNELAVSSPYSSVLNGRFRGGWTTRHYGQPASGVHAIQMEIAQSAYLKLEEAPWRYDEARAGELRRWLGYMLKAINSSALEITEQRAS